MEKYTKMLGIDNFSLNDYVRMVNTHGDIFGYQISQHIELSPDSRNMRIFFEAEDPDNLKGAVINYSCMLAHHPLKLKTIKVTESPNLFIVDYEQCSKEKEAYESVISHFGGNQLLLDEIQSNIQFWRNAVNIIKADGHEDVIISRDILQRFLKSHDFSEQLSNLISIIYGVSIEDSEYQDLNGFIEEICATSGLIYRIEYDYNEIKIYHKFNDSNIINIINGTVIKTFEISGHHFMLKKDGKMTILSRRVV